MQNAFKHSVYPHYFIYLAFNYKIMKKIVLDGARFSNMAQFYDEVEKVFTANLTWKIGRNLSAFNDVLRGGFGVFEYDEKILLIWKNSAKSRKELEKFDVLIEIISNHSKHIHFRLEK